MKGLIRTPVRPLVVTTMTLCFFATSASTVGATSYTTTTNPNPQPVCGVVANPSVHFVSKQSPCEIRVRRGTYVHIKLESGFRWGYPVSSSRVVVVSDISRNSVGVFAATLHAAATGRATIRTTGSVYCKPGVVCPDLALLWSLEVIVTK